MSIMPRKVHIKPIVLLICATVAVAQAYITKNTVEGRLVEPVILERVLVEDVELSGMTRSEAEEVLYQYVDEVVLQPLVLVSGDEAWQLDPMDIGLHVFVLETVERALAVGRTGSWLENWYSEIFLK